MKLPPLEYACPTSLSEAVKLLASRNGDARAIAGGQSLMPMLAFRVVAPALLVDLRKLTELKEIKIGADGLRLGAMVRWRDIEDDARLAAAHPLLKAAVEHATVAPSVAASLMPIRRRRCPASASPATRKYRSWVQMVRARSRPTISSSAR
jgi:hypothetical protein